MSEKYFHFTIGPVQSFVAQARRTRDFWAGSFILSWLSAIAIREVVALDSRAEVEFPELDKQKLVDQIEQVSTADRPQQGSIPNRFKVRVYKTDFPGELVEQAVNTVWKQLAERIWELDLADFCRDKPLTRKIWERQIVSAWEISWAISDIADDSSIIDQRKNWRVWHPPEEAGINCSVMAGWQELSGQKRAGKGQRNFWDNLRASVSRPGMKTDLREHECLCAIAFVKRRFSREQCFENLMAQTASGCVAKGWPLPINLPSVVWMAAVHWLEAALDKPDEFMEFYKSCSNLGVEHGEFASHTKIACINRKVAGNKQLWKFASLDGECFFPELLQHLHKERAGPAVLALDNLIKAVALGPPSPFYAVLMMDGDSLGKNLSVTGLQSHISAALARFTDRVDAIVSQHNGFLIYAGGDDVLALSPLEDATQCAVALRREYQQAFRSVPETKPDEYIYTISAAIQYVHVKTPLTRVLQDTHSLLDDYAKDHCGRDSIAIRVRKPGGDRILWGQPWEVALNNQRLHIDELADTFFQNESKREGFSSRFFYKLRQTFSDMKLGGSNASELQLASKLMESEYLNAYGRRFDEESGGAEIEQGAKKIIQTLLSQSVPQMRLVQETSDVIGHKAVNYSVVNDSQIALDAAFVVRFLASKGVAQ